MNDLFRNSIKEVLLYSMLIKSVENSYLCVLYRKTCVRTHLKIFGHQSLPSPCSIARSERKGPELKLVELHFSIRRSTQHVRVAPHTDLELGFVKTRSPLVRVELLGQFEKISLKFILR